MRTPAGKDCRFYYQDFHRGRNVQECRLIKANPDSLPWVQSDCSRCPVPEILNANSSRYLELQATVRAKLLGLRREIEVTAHCSRHHIVIEDPYVGCPQCNAERPGLDLFRQALDQSSDD